MDQRKCLRAQCHQDIGTALDRTVRLHCAVVKGRVGKVSANETGKYYCSKIYSVELLDQTGDGVGHSRKRPNPSSRHLFSRKHDLWQEFFIITAVAAAARCPVRGDCFPCDMTIIIVLENTYFARQG